VLTAENLRTEVINLWRDAKTDPSSVLMVTNNIQEAVSMATRIVVMGSNPGQIRTVLENPLLYPREPYDPRFTAMADRIHEILTTALIPDVPVAPAKTLRTGRIEVFPNVTPGEIAGLLERLDADRGRADLFDLSVEIGREFGKLLAAVKAAELLGFVETPKDMAVLTAAGKDYLEAKVNQRKRTLNQLLRTLGVFHHIIEMLRRQEALSVDEDLVLEELAVRLPTEKPQTMFRTMVRWGRYAELFGYNADERKLYLDVESTSAPFQPELTIPPA
jgi:NitT/TauT family transport system ATP-binding protein